MEVYDWSRLPPEVLVEIFQHIPSKKLLVNIPLVCRAWRDTQHHLVQQLSFWWERLEQEGIQITRDHREDLIKNVDKQKLVKLLKATSVPDMTFTQKFDDYGKKQNIVSGNDPWRIQSYLVSLASVYLMIRPPDFVSIEFSTQIPAIEDLDLLLLQISHTDCSVTFEDMDSFLFMSSFPADDILRHVKRNNVKCLMTSFSGYVRSISSLPRTIDLLRLSIQCDENGKAIDPDISTIQQNFPRLTSIFDPCIRFSVRPGTDFSALPLMPHYLIETITDEFIETLSSKV